MSARRMALLVACFVVAAPLLAQAQTARERERAAAAAESKRAKDLAQAGLPEEIATCHARLERALTRNRKYEAFRSAEQAVEVTRAKAKGKFTPRFPVDVQEVARFPGELRTKRKSAEQDETWVPAEAWCGLVDGKLVAVDVFGPGEKRAP